MIAAGGGGDPGLDIVEIYSVQSGEWRTGEATLVTKTQLKSRLKYSNRAQLYLAEKPEICT